MKKGILMGISYVLLVCSLAGCGNAKNNEEEAASIQVVQAGHAYAVNDRCQVLETYSEYNVQISVEEISSRLLTQDGQLLELRTHEVYEASETEAENGRYDIVDRVNVALKFKDKSQVLNQTVNKDVYFMRNTENSLWEIKREDCRKWDVGYKKLGGTAWKLTTEEGDIYFRLQDVIEYFNIRYVEAGETADRVEFYMNMVGVMYGPSKGESNLRRIQITSGTLKDTGEVLVNLGLPDEGESMEICLSDCELIDREDVPFSEQEFRRIADR